MSNCMENELSQRLTNPWITICTPTYNRRNTIGRCYESLLKLKRPKDSDGEDVEFEWIIVDDGSSDDTESLVKEWIDENRLPIRYYRQENQGKHVAHNFAVDKAKGTMFLVLDSDDSILEDGLAIFYEEWMSIPENDRERIKGVACRCRDHETGERIGSPLPESPFIVSTPDLRYKYNVTGELWGFNRVDLLRRYKMPVFKEHTHFCPEAIVWCEMGKKYKDKVVDRDVRDYFTDSGNSITGGRSRERAYANYYLWQYNVNNLVANYFRYSPKEMTKALVGISMDGFRTGRSVSEILSDVESRWMKVAVALLMPAGFVLSKR